jgi:hypothetical protein
MRLAEWTLRACDRYDLLERRKASLTAALQVAEPATPTRSGMWADLPTPDVVVNVPTLRSVRKIVHRDDDGLVAWVEEQPMEEQ